MEQTIAGLGKRVFLLHSVHEPAPVTFETRWTLSYLAGPMTRDQIRSVTAQSHAQPTFAAGSGSSAPLAATSISSTGGSLGALDAAATRVPVLPHEIAQFYLPPLQQHRGPLQYHPVVLGLADVSFANVKLGVTEQRRVSLLAPVEDGPIALEWDSAERVEIEPSLLEKSPREGAAFGAVPTAATTVKNYAVWTKTLQKWIVTNEQVTLFRSAAFKTTSSPSESEAQFRIRLQVLSHEARDAKIEVLRGKYATKLAAMQDKLRRAEQTVQRESQQASQAKMDTAISVGGAILGAIFGRGKVGVGTLGKVATATRGAGRAAQQAGDVSRAQESLEALQQQQAELEAKLQVEVDALGAAYDAQQESLETVLVKAKGTDVLVQRCGLLWVPYVKDANGMVTAAWR
jgi:Skp family chaperone for outer membrane proteins